jgi:Fe-S cluster assembly protein SufD
VLSLDRDAHSMAAGRLPAALVGRAQRGFAAFERLPAPTPKDEDWRYVEIDVDLAALTIPTEAGDSLDSGDAVSAAVVDVSGRARSVDGITVAAEGSEDVMVSALGDAPERAFDGFEFPEAPDAIAAAHDAFASDGVVVHAGRGRSVAAPVVIDLQATIAGGLVLPLVLVRADEQASISVVIDQRSPDGASCTVIPRIEVIAGDAARVEVTVIQSWGDATVALALHRMRAGRDATVEFAESGFGGAFSRLMLDVSLLGRGASSRVVGAYFGDRNQTLDYRYFMRHMAPNTTSEMFLKGAVGDVARAVFTGLIRIEPEGQKTNAHQTNRNLVLSEGAEAHSVPNLEILADDVRCGHGSAVGPLDEDQRYYLMSRGLTERRADRVQVRGFFEEALSRFPIGSVVPVLRERALDKYEAVVA